MEWRVWITWWSIFKVIHISDIQDYFEYIIKKHQKMNDNLPIRIYINKIENRITFRIKTGCYVELLTPETINLLGSTKSKINQDR